MSILGAIKGASAVAKLGVAAFPFVMLAGGHYLTKWSMNAEHKTEITALNEKIENLETKFDNSQKLLDDCKTDKINLGAEITALEKQRLAAAQAQLDLVRENQKVTADAIRAATAASSRNDDFFADLARQLGDVEYETNCEADDVRIIGGGRVLRNAAKGPQ